MAVELVVDLPADDVGIVLEVLGHLLDDALGKAAVDGRVVAVLAAGLVVDGAAIRIDRQHLGISAGQPLGRSGGGRAQDGLDAVARQDGDGAVEQAEVEGALLGLHQVPGEFAHAHDVDAGILHQARIPVPVAFGPLLGVVGDAEQEVVVALGGAGGDEEAQSEEKAPHRRIVVYRFSRRTSRGARSRAAKSFR